MYSVHDWLNTSNFYCLNSFFSYVCRSKVNYIYGTFINYIKTLIFLSLLEIKLLSFLWHQMAQYCLILHIYIDFLSSFYSINNTENINIICHLFLREKNSNGNLGRLPFKVLIKVTTSIERNWLEFFDKWLDWRS